MKVIQKQNGLSVLIGTLDSICRVINKQAVNIVMLRTHIAGALAGKKTAVVVGGGGGGGGRGNLVVDKEVEVDKKR